MIVHTVTYILVVPALNGLINLKHDCDHFALPASSTVTLFNFLQALSPKHTELRKSAFGTRPLSPCVYDSVLVQVDLTQIKLKYRINARWLDVQCSRTKSIRNPATV